MEKLEFTPDEIGLICSIANVKMEQIPYITRENYKLLVVPNLLDTIKTYYNELNSFGMRCADSIITKLETIETNNCDLHPGNMGEESSAPN